MCRSDMYVTHVVDPKLIQCLSNLDLLGSVEESIGELFSFSQCTLNDLKIGNIAEEISDWLIRIRANGVGV